MAFRRKRIAILFCGGTTLDERDRPGDTVRAPKDMDRWLAQMGEMEIIASIEPFFVYGGEGAAIGAKQWVQVAGTIGREAKRFDGFFVLHAIDTLAYSAAALSFMLQKLPVPVVMTGSPIVPKEGRRQTVSKEGFGQYSSLGVKANLVNALQVAVSEVAEVCVVFGSRIFRGSQVTMNRPGALNAFDSYDRIVLGKIDFGTKFFSHYVRRGDRALKVSPKFDPNVLQLDVQPGLPSLQPLESAVRSKAHGVFVTAMHITAIPQRTLDALASWHRRGVPVALYAHHFAERPKQLPFLFVELMSPVAALVKFMWARGQTSDPKRLQKLLDQDSAGEHVPPTSPRAV
ncbi:MAG: asparaginase [Candidatus Kerfeldbacteria bacterium]|nr:asparaginase [Candidatus Kerfeldbacteria bacterium]